MYFYGYTLCLECLYHRRVMATPLGIKGVAMLILYLSLFTYSKIFNVDSKNVNLTFAPFSVLIVPRASAVLCLFYQWIEYLVLFFVPFSAG